MRSRASLENDVTRFRNEIAIAATKGELSNLLNRRDFTALPESAKKDLQVDVNARWKVVQ